MAYICLARIYLLIYIPMHNISEAKATGLIRPTPSLPPSLGVYCLNV